MIRRVTPTVLAATLICGIVSAQGPLPAYLADPATELPWASCSVHLQAGARHRIPFLPVVSQRTRAPLGTNKYTTDVRVDAPVIFVGNGIVRQGRFDAYGDLDVAGKVVLFAYDFPDATHAELEKEVTLEDRVREAAARRAAAVVVFSMQNDAPFPAFRDQPNAATPEIPVVAVNRRSAEVILAASGTNAASAFEKWKSEGTFSAAALIAQLDLRMDGAFAAIRGRNFTFVFDRAVSAAQREELASANEKAVTFILDLFKDTHVSWRPSFVAYFRDFDSKIFYTHHWGSGLSSDAGVFMVFDPAAVSFGLAVHENTHTLLAENWGGTSSFMTEGLARYAESMATRRDRDHAQTRAFEKEHKLFPLGDMVKIDIGSDPRTPVAYPAAGSFVAYLVTTYGLDAVATAFRLEGREDAARAQQDSWKAAFKKDLGDLEAGWLKWLASPAADPLDEALD
jgi:PA domain-containing protein